MNRYALIMAGGSGSRLWPISRRHLPKQYNNIFSDRSTFEHILEIVLRCVPAGNIYATVGTNQYDYVVKSVIPRENILLQRENKNTAPAILHCLSVLGGITAEGTLAVIPSDHIISNEDELKKVIDSAYFHAETTGNIVAVGTKPLYPSTGFGYLECAQGRKELKKVINFREKPAFKDAVRYMGKKRYLWNTGLYISRTDVLIEQYARHLPDTYGLISDMDTFYDKARPVSLDRGIIEKSEVLYVLPSKHEWIDAGTFEFMEYCFTRDKSGNTVHGDGIFVESSGTSVFSEKKTVVSFGTKNLLIVNTPDVVMVCDKKYIQQIGRLVEKLRETDRNDIL